MLFASTLAVWLLANGVTPVAPLADPMQPPAASVQAAAPTVAAVPAPTYTLSAIKVVGNRRSAIINNQLVKVGDTVNGARVLKIGFDSVAITSGETHLALRLNRHDIKQRAKAATSP